jgi:hypothetical protein
MIFEVLEVVQLLIRFLMKLTLRYWVFGSRNFEETYCPKFKETKCLRRHFNCWTREQHMTSKRPQWRSHISQRKEIHFEGLYFVILSSYLLETPNEILFIHIFLLFFKDHLMERLFFPYSFRFSLIQLSNPNGPGSRLRVVRVLPISNVYTSVILSQTDWRLINSSF